MSDSTDGALRRSFTAQGLPAEAPVFDRERWAAATAPRARRQLAQAQRRKRAWFALASAAAAAVLVALPALHDSVVRPQAASGSAVPVWSGKGPLFDFRMVSAGKGWAMSGVGPPIILRTKSGPRGFQAVSHFPVAVGHSAYGYSWHVFGARSALLAVGNLVPHAIVVARTADGGAHWSDTRLVMPRQDGRWFYGSTYWWSGQDGLMVVRPMKRLPHGVTVMPGSWLYRTTTGGRQWAPLVSNLSGMPGTSRPGVIGLTGRATVIAAAGASALWRSANGGRTFGRVVLPPPPGGGSLAIVPGGLAFSGQGATGVLLATDGTTAVAYRTTDGGAQWSLAAEFPNAPEPLLSASGADWWVTSASWPEPKGSGQVWRSTDGGRRWTSLGTPARFSALMHQGFQLHHVSFVSARVGYAVWQTKFYGQEILATANGGVSWSVARSGSVSPGP